MKKRVWMWMHLCLVPVICLGLTLSLASAQSIGMVTGSETGTYIKFGQDIARVAGKEGIEVDVKPSEGSLDNIRRLRSKENAAMAIVQSDLLGFLSRSKDQDIKDLSKDLKLVFPFYNEEVHLLAKKEIQRFQDLSGKRVVVGTKGSGNYLTANNLLNILGVNPSERVELSPVEAVSEVLTGEADAMFYVSGKPVDLFKNMEKMQQDKDPQYAKLVKAVHFVPLNHPEMLKEYAVSTIGPQDYAWVTEPVATVAVKAALVTYDFSSKKNDYFRSRCTQIATIANAVRNSIDELKQTGHPKWKEVKLAQETGIWQWDACSRLTQDTLGNGSATNPEQLKNSIQNYLKGID